MPTPSRSCLGMLVLAGLAAGLSTGCSSSGGSASDLGPSDVSGRYILSLCDADMVASALVEPNLLGPRADGERDMVTIIGLPLAKSEDPAYNTPFAQIPVSNSVMGPPQAVAVTMDGRWAYVIENQGPAPAGATTIHDLPNGKTLTRLDLSNPTMPVEAGTMTVGENPMAVDISPDGAYLVIASQQKRKQLQIVPISDAGMGAAVDFPLLGMDDDENTVPTCVNWHPSGEYIAVTVPNGNRVMFYQVTKDGGIGLKPWGQPVVVGKYPYSGKFTPDGRFYVTTDMQWGSDVPGIFVEPPPGQLSVVSFSTSPDPVHEVVSASPVGINPEGLALSPDGTLVVTSNQLRSFLPEGDLRLTPGGSLTLLKLDPRTGQLTYVQECLINSMPVGLSFDAKGNFVVVSQFRSFNPEVVTGELAFFAVTKGSEPKLEKADFNVGVGKGPHGVLIIR